MKPLIRLILGEDQVTIDLMRQLAIDTGLDVADAVCLNVGGNPNFWKKLASLRKEGLSDSRVVLAIADADRGGCIGEFLGKKTYPVHPNLVLRLAVREAEAWLLADSTALGPWLNIESTQIPTEPDELFDPKQMLLACVRHSTSRLVRKRLVFQDANGLRPGAEYNTALSEFIETSWSPTRAATRSPSLARALKALKSLKKPRK